MWTKRALALLSILALSCAVYWFLGNARINPVQAAQLDFDKGIGYYVFSEGELHFLYYPSATGGGISVTAFGRRESALENNCVSVSPEDFALYSYGLDFSNNQLPPYLNGFAVRYFFRGTSDWKGKKGIESSSEYATQFKPIAGYDQPTYEIHSVILESLKNGTTEHIMWGLGAASQASYFLFRFADTSE